MPIDVGNGRRIGPNVTRTTKRRPAPIRAYQQTIHPSNVSAPPRAERQYTAAYNLLSHAPSAGTGNLPAGIQPYIGDVLDAAKRYNVDPALLLGQQEQESGFNPNAVSSAGAFGISQFIPSTAREFGVMPGSSKAAVRSQIQGQAHYMAVLGAQRNPTEALNRYLGVGGTAPTSYSSNILANAQKYAGALGPSQQEQAKRERARGIVAGMGMKPPTIAQSPSGQLVSLTPQQTAQAFKGHYINPYHDITEIDRGVDFGGTGPIGAIGKGRVVDASSSSGWPGGGWTAYQLLKGPRKGWTVFVAENAQPTVRPGQVVKKGQIVAQQSGGIETGWAAKPGTQYQSQRTLADLLGDPRVASRHESHEGGDTTPDPSVDPAAGIDFFKFLKGKPGVGAGQLSGSGASLAGFSAGFGGSVPVGSSDGSGAQQQAAVPYVPAYSSANRGGIAASAPTPLATQDLQAALATILGGGSTAGQAAPDSAVPALAQILQRQRFRPRR